MAVWSAPTAPVAMSSTLIEEGPLTVAAINQKLAEYQTHYNTYRPHDGIGFSPQWSIISNSHRLPDLSHMY